MSQNVRPKIDMVGQKYGRLTVTDLVTSHDKHTRWKAICECGNVKEYKGILLRQGKTKSCGCLQRELVAERMSQSKKTHGLTYTDTWHSWRSMRNRCLTKSHKSYARYKDVKICDRWLVSFEAFLEDMGERPAGCTLDRIDNEGPYSPGNCRWATQKTQSRNRRGNAVLTLNGESCTIAEWAEKIGVRRSTISKRLNAYGKTVEECLSPVTLKMNQPLIPVGINR